jgi:hypothetical protein
VLCAFLNLQAHLDQHNPTTVVSMSRVAGRCRQG